MHIGRNYSLKEVLFWTWREIFGLLVFMSIPTVLYEFVGWKWLIIPWLPIALVGTAVAFLVGFKNNAAYDRTWEARKAWGAIVNGSRAWGMMVRDYISNRNATTPLSEEDLQKIRKQLIYRHFAWLTALRFQLREARTWEAIQKSYNQDYRRFYSVEEQDQAIDSIITPYLSESDKSYVFSKKNKAAHLISMQSKQLKACLDQQLIEDYRHMELEEVLIDFFNQQGVCERIKNFPYPRQFATVNLYFVRLFIGLLPFGMLQEFEKMGDYFVWLTIPFGALVGWIFTTMEKIGESTENPFEGSPNDVPITAMSRTIEIDLREMLDESDLPPALASQGNILM